MRLVPIALSLILGVATLAGCARPPLARLSVTPVADQGVRVVGALAARPLPGFRVQAFDPWGFEHIDHLNVALFANDALVGYFPFAGPFGPGSLVNLGNLKRNTAYKVWLKAYNANNELITDLAASETTFDTMIDMVGGAEDQLTVTYNMAFAARAWPGKQKVVVSGDPGYDQIVVELQKDDGMGGWIPLGSEVLPNTGGEVWFQNLKASAYYRVVATGSSGGVDGPPVNDTIMPSYAASDVDGALPDVTLITPPPAP